MWLGKFKRQSNASASWCSARSPTGPQTVTRNGKEVVVVIAADEYRRQRRKEENLRFLDFLSRMPEVPEEFLERQRDFPRDVDF